jgi:hypothetical protein
LTNEMRKRLEKAIEDLLKSIEKNGLKPPGNKGDEPITQELPKFDPKPVEQNMSKLSELSKSIFDAIRRKDRRRKQSNHPPHEHDNNDEK